MCQRQNITAIIYDKRGMQISMGKNSYTKTHPLQAKLAKDVGLDMKVYLHAEIDALVRLKDWSKAHKIVVMRYNGKGEPLNAKPCKICQKAIEQAGIQIVQHT